MVTGLSVLPWSVAHAPRLPGADCADVVQSTWPRLQEAVLTLAIRGIDVLNQSLGCFDNEPDSHLVMAHLVEHLHVTSTTSGPSPPGRRSGSRHRAAVPRLVALVRHVPVGCHRLRSDRRGDGRKAAHRPPGRHLLRAGQQWPGCATEPGDGVPAVPVVRPVDW